MAKTSAIREAEDDLFPILRSYGIPYQCSKGGMENVKIGNKAQSTKSKREVTDEKAGNFSLD